MRVNPIRRCSALFFGTWALVSVASAQSYRPIVDHVHLSAPDPATAVSWYRQHFGGEPMTEGIDRLLYGDVRVVFSRREKTLPSQGSAVDHIGFSVPDIDATMKTLEAAGVKVEGPVRDVAGLFKLAFIEDPWGTRIEVVQDPAKLGVHHIHLRGPDPAAMLAWYSTQFGGRVGKLKDRIDGIDLGGVWILVQRGEAVPTIGHSIDHIGFRPVDVDASVAALKTQNVKITTEPRPLSFPNGVSVRLAFAEAPDGVRIELVQRPELTAAPQLAYEVRQLTFGPAHHFYGYIGHVGNSPYSADGKYLVALRTTFQDRMPRSDDAADIVLLDVAKNYAEIKVGETRGWNPQQGAMMYWNPEQPSRQFFFNDRDSNTGKVFTALYDVVDRKRVREFRFDESPVANGGVKQSGGAFAAINYARMARLRPVTGYPGAWDWTEGVNHPQDDGLFVVDPKTGGRKLIVSFRQMRDALVAKHPEVDDRALFLNHTLWNREGDRLFFFVRADFNDPKRRVNVPMTVRPDGSELIEQRIFIGGHPEWDFKSRMIGRVEDKLVLYDTLSQQIVETIGGPEMFRDPEGDTALSRDGKWIVNGATTGATMHYTVLRRADRAHIKTEDFSRAGYVGGDLRIDPAPCWNREGDRFVFPALAKDGTRQMFQVRVLELTN